nr:MAG TPA: N-acetylmuramoyl-L-alanine amidase [Caudoviricetes sp.]
MNNMYTLTQSIVEAPKHPSGLCLADWDQVPGFNWTDPEKAASLILPVRLQAKLGAIDQAWSPNGGGFGVMVPTPAELVVLHWWGNPVGQSHDSVVSWLRNPVSQVSAHVVISPNRVTQLLNWRTPSWANGNTWANCNAITIEADPNDPDATIGTIVGFLADRIADGTLTSDFALHGHQDYYQTACPGSYYPRLGEIRQRVTAALKKEEDMPLSEQDLDRIGHRVWGHMIDTGEHAAAAWARLADAENRVIALCDGRAPLAPRSEQPGAHAAPIGHALGNVEARVIALDDRTRAIETQLEQILETLTLRKDN